MIINADGAPNAARTILLWENPDIEKIFDEQTIEVNTKAHPVFYVSFCISTNDSDTFTDMILTDVDTAQLIRVRGHDSVHMRYVTVTDSGLAFGAGNKVTDNSLEPDNYAVVPYRIYGG